MSARRGETTEVQAQEDLLRLDAYRGQLNALVQQFQYLASSRGDHLRAREALEGLERAQDGTDILIPIGGDTLLHTSPDHAAKVFLGIGSGYVVELERPRVSEILAQRIEKMDQAAQDLEGQIRLLEDRIQQLAVRLEAAGRAVRDTNGGSTDDVGRD